MPNNNLMQHIITARAYLEEASRSLNQAARAPDNYLLDHKHYALIKKTEARLKYLVRRLYHIQRDIHSARAAHKEAQHFPKATPNNEPNNGKSPSPDKRPSPLQEATDR